MKQIQAFIADDEPLARDWLRTLLLEEPGVTLAGEATGSTSSGLSIPRPCPLSSS